MSRAERELESRKRLSDMPVSRLFPNMVTIAGLCCGVSSIRFALAEKWEVAVAFIVIAAILDALDGLVARLLKATSSFGAQLDSLSDVICFGVAPAIVFWLWALSDFKRYGWAAVLLYIACCALRLARFNVSITKELKHPFQRFFFTGVPAPGGALLATMPLMLSFHDIDIFHERAPIGALYLSVIGALMASRLPTFAPKNFRISQDYIPYLLIVATIVLAFLVIEPWLTMSIGSILYLAGIPISAYTYHRVVHKGRGVFPDKA